MAKPIFEVVDALPKSNMTVRMLQALDWVVPGEYENIVGFENTIRAVTRETDQAMIQQIGERAIALYNDRNQGYQRALWLYQTVDYMQGISGFAALMGKIGESVPFLSFLNRVTPKADTTQAIDFSLKLTAEIAAFCQLNGVPGDSVGDFVKSLADYKHESLMRMAALICVDGLIPLGPDFISKSLGLLDSVGATGLESNSRFQKIKEYIPGANVLEQLAFIQQGVSTAKDWMSGFVTSKNLGVGTVVDNLKGYIDGLEGKLDYLGAFLDMTVNYYEHTGVQTVARSLITRAASEV
jgi:hypothetical protein